ncbi:MAG: metallophosphoesterase [Planctomycetes bacterium]|nr:metallophosphoesterase [Planctomycetota bacterium]
MESLKLAQISDLHLRDSIPGSSGDPCRQSRLMPLALRDSLDFFKTQAVDLVIITGDLVDVPLPHHKENDQQVIAEYKKVKDVLDAGGIDYQVIPGNHDDPDCFFQVFEKQACFEKAGYEFYSFYDHQDGGNDVYRQDEELELFKKACQKEGPRNQIHLQHYLITPDQNDGWPHTYSNADEILEQIANSSRMLLSLSGHYHPGSDLLCEGLGKGESYFYVAKSFSEDYFHHSIFILNEGAVHLAQGDIRDAGVEPVVESSYGKRGAWHRGNVHMHCTESSPCSDTLLSRGVQAYSEGEHAFLAITDHDVITDLTAIKAQYPDIIFFEGFEHSVSNHMLFVKESVKPLFEMKDKKGALLHADDYLTVVCHPQGPARDYWTVDELKAYPQLPTGVEVFNGHYGVETWRQKGGGWEYTQFWSDCLDAGLRLFAYANDDFHDLIDTQNAWNVVQTTEKTPAAILAALKSGAFYASTGLSLQSIQEYRGKVVVNFTHKVHGRFMGPGNACLSNDYTDSFEMTHTDEAYIRFEAEDNGKKLWTQPFYAVAMPVVV